MLTDSLGRHRSDDYHYAFTDEEFETICAVADGVTVWLGQGFARQPDPEFAGELVRVLGRTGIHPSRVGLLGPANLRDDILTWPRPKTSRWPWVPVHHELSPWIEGFLSKPKPRHRGAYNPILGRVEQQIAEEEGVRIHLNPLRFRHFAAKTLLEMGVPVPVVCEFMGCSEKMLRYYSNQGPQYVRDLLRSKGW